MVKQTCFISFYFVKIYRFFRDSFTSFFYFNVPLGFSLIIRITRLESTTNWIFKVNYFPEQRGPSHRKNVLEALFYPRFIQFPRAHVRLMELPFWIPVEFRFLMSGREWNFPGNAMGAGTGHLSCRRWRGGGYVLAVVLTVCWLFVLPSCWPKATLRAPKACQSKLETPGREPHMALMRGALQTKIQMCTQSAQEVKDSQSSPIYSVQLKWGWANSRADCLPNFVNGLGLHSGQPSGQFRFALEFSFSLRKDVSESIRCGH